MDTKRFILSASSVFLFIFIFDWVFHDFVLKETYLQTASPDIALEFLNYPSPL
jgi:hypothetical protein